MAQRAPRHDVHQGEAGGVVGLRAHNSTMQLEQRGVHASATQLCRRFPSSSTQAIPACSLPIPCTEATPAAAAGAASPHLGHKADLLAADVTGVGVGLAVLQHNKPTSNNPHLACILSSDSIPACYVWASHTKASRSTHYANRHAACPSTIMCNRLREFTCLGRPACKQRGAHKGAR